MDVKVLDCTLRDGGYINDWCFGAETVQSIISELILSGIDYVECGFLKDSLFDEDKTWFNDVGLLEQYFSKLKPTQKLSLLLNYGEFNPKKLKENPADNVVLRIAFRKNNLKLIKDYSKKIRSKGYEISVNPMITDSYTKDELLFLIDEVNEISPRTLTITDTIGDMTYCDISNIFDIIDTNLDNKIALGFHSHNNMQMSFANTQQLISLSKNRDLIIDSSVFGMGRGAGNLCTELISRYLNKTCSKRYDITRIISIAKEYIMPIYENHPWGYCAEYYLTAINKCHPDYAKFLLDKKVDTTTMAKIFENIPKDKRFLYDKNLINELCIELGSSDSVSFS